MFTVDNKIEKYYPPLYEGHNTEMKYRYLAFLPVAFLAYDLISYKTFLYTRYRINDTPINRWTHYFKPTNPSNKKFYFMVLPAYLTFDFIYRNLKFNKNKNTNYLVGYNLDLALFHSMATLLFPFMTYKISANFLPVFWSKFIRMRYPMLFLSLGSFVALGALQVKGMDILSDYILDQTYRKYIFNFKNEFTGLKTIKFEALDDLKDSFNLSNTKNVSAIEEKLEYGI